MQARSIIRELIAAMDMKDESIRLLVKDVAIEYMSDKNTVYQMDEFDNWKASKI